MPGTGETGPRAWYRRILLADQSAARLVEPGTAVVHGDRHHGIGTAVAAHLHAYHIVRHVELTELDFSVRVQRNPLTRPFSDYHFDSFLGFPHPNYINGFQAWQLRRNLEMYLSTHSYNPIGLNNH